ncbi:SRPBCC family protein [uncultured Jatrophihabitans sp.]|uniref:SRPBCC family protein n=1 Tax=uncultured Jatrophihabitans sp. TaxID=1610747 RepID=UPI0035CBA526
MPSVSRTFTVTLPLERAVEYLKDFGNAVDWDPGTETCTRNDSGPIAVGANWHNVSKIMGVKAELTYTLEKLEADEIVLVGKNDSATSTDTLTFRPADGGTEITYRADLEMHGAAKLASPIMKLEFEKLAGETEKKMTETLNGLAV